jgi:tol-pal system protein YbgF
LGEKGDAAAGTEDLNALIEGVDKFEAASETNTEVNEYSSLKTKLDELNDALSKKSLEIDDLKSQLSDRKDRIAELQGNRRSGSRARSSSTSYSDLSDISGSYNDALQTFYAKDYETSIQLFTKLVETYPQHKLASNCLYWIGESYFGKQDYVNATHAFEQVLNYENSNKSDDALLMLGRCYIKLGDKQMAAQMFQQLMNSYPDSEYFERAQRYASSM